MGQAIGAGITGAAPADEAGVISPANPIALLRIAVDALMRAAERAPAADALSWSPREREDVITALDEITRRTAVYRGAVLVAHRRDGAWSASGDRDFHDWRGRTTQAGRGPARAELVAAEAMHEAPELARAVESGQATTEHAKTLGDVARDASDAVRRALADGGRDRLVEMAGNTSAPRFRTEVRRWAASVDATAAQRRHDALRARRSVVLRKDGGGLRLEAFFDPVAGATVRTAIEAMTTRPAADDPRTTAQRRADALTSLCERALGEGSTRPGAQVRPHVSLIVPTDTWARAIAVRAAAEDHLTLVEDQADGADGAEPVTSFAALDGTTPAQLLDGSDVAPSEFERIMCDCTITRMVMGAEGIPLDVGREQRTYTGALRRAALVRDRHCMWPDCSIPAAWCEVHHVVWFTKGGRTSLDNALALCSFHHHEVHRHRIRITTTAAGIEFRRHGGRLIGTTRRGSPGGLAPVAETPPAAARSAPPGGTPSTPRPGKPPAQPGGATAQPGGSAAPRRSASSTAHTRADAHAYADAPARAQPTRGSDERTGRGPPRPPGRRTLF